MKVEALRIGFTRVHYTRPEATDERIIANAKADAARVRIDPSLLKFDEAVFVSDDRGGRSALVPVVPGHHVAAKWRDANGITELIDVQEAPKATKK